MYFVAGNHEYWDPAFEGLIALFNKYGVNWLVDQNQVINVNGNIINVAGLDDSEGYFFWNRSLTSLERLNNIHFNSNYLSILLSHRPELDYFYRESNFDLIFVGHAHGGQVRIPFFNQGIYAPNQGLFPRYTRGVYTLNENTKMIVSTGLDVNYLPRVFNRPELVIVDIISE